MLNVRCCVVRGLTTASVRVRMYACWQVWGKHWQYHTEKKFKYTHKKYWKYVAHTTQPPVTHHSPPLMLVGVRALLCVQSHWRRNL